jgi:hypothetical protein
LGGPDDPQLAVGGQRSGDERAEKRVIIDYEHRDGFGLKERWIG